MPKLYYFIKFFPKHFQLPKLIKFSSVEPSRARNFPSGHKNNTAKKNESNSEASRYGFYSIRK